MNASTIRQAQAQLMELLSTVEQVRDTVGETIASRQSTEAIRIAEGTLRGIKQSLEGLVSMTEADMLISAIALIPALLVRVRATLAKVEELTEIP